MSGVDAAFAVGIDVGYSAVRIAVFNQECEDQVSDVCLIENDLGSLSTPTVVAYDEQTRLIGVEAISHAALFPEDAVFNIKRLVGRRTEEVQNYLDECFFQYSTDEGRLSIHLPHRDPQNYTIEYLLAFIFDKLKEYADNEGITVEAAVFSVPFDFNQIRRQAVLDAAQIAGIKVLRLINDTTSVALNYAWEKLESDYIQILIIDFGASKLDVSLIQINDYEIKDLTTISNTNLGGVDFDNRLMQLCISKISEEYHIPTFDLEQNGRFLHKLRIQCEKAKISLNDKSVAHIKIDTPVNEKDINFTVNRQEFESVTEELFQQAMNTVVNVANTAGDKINDLIVVGGSSRLKRFENALKNEFQKRRLNRPMNVHEAVVKGNAILAAKIIKLDDKKIVKIELNDHFAMDLDQETSLEDSGEYFLKTVESWKGLSDSQILKYQNDLEAYKENKNTDDVKIMVKNDAQTLLFDVKLTFKRLKGNIDYEEQIKEEIDVKDGEIEAASEIEQLNKLKEELQKFKQYVDEQLSIVEAERNQRISDIYEMINDFRPLLMENQIIDVNRYADEICGICRKIDSNRDVTLRNLKQYHTDVEQCITNFRTAVQQEQVRRSSAKASFFEFIVKFKQEDKLVKFQHLKSYGTCRQELLDKIDATEYMIESNNYSTDEIDILTSQLVRKTEDLYRRLEYDENERLKERDTVSSLFTRLTQVINNNAHLIPVIEKQKIEQFVLASHENLQKSPLATIDQLQELHKKLNHHLEKIDSLILQEMERNSSKNKLLLNINNLYDNYVKGRKRKPLKSGSVKKIQTGINEVTLWMVDNPSATEGEYDTQIRKIIALETYAQRKLQEVAKEAVNEFIGIDFGTDSCCLSVFKNNEWSILLDQNSNIPSYVAFADEILIGKNAKDHYAVDNKNTIYSMKRFLGIKGFYDSISDKSDISYSFEDKTDKFMITLQKRSNTRMIEPVEIIAMLFVKMRTLAQNNLGKVITSVTISVPVCFCCSQRQEIKDAALIAGFKNIKLLNDTTAAALKIIYPQWVDLKPNEIMKPRNVLVVSIGSAFTSVSILESTSNGIELKVHRGEQVGGTDFDKVLHLYIKNKASKYRKFNEIESIELLRKCEACKIKLSTYSEASIVVNELCNGLAYAKTVKRQEFEKICAQLILRVIKIVQLSLQSVNMNAEQINDVILVGGTTAIPELQHYFRVMFQTALHYNCTKEAIAIGCAIYSSITAENNSKFRIQEISNIEYAFDDNVIIHINSKLPKLAEGVLISKFHRQHFHEFKLHEMLEESKRIIGEYTIIPKRQLYVQEPKFCVKIELDESGIIAVKYSESGETSIEELFIKGRIASDKIKHLKQEMKQLMKNMCKEIRIIEVRNQLRFQLDTITEKLSRLPLNYTENMVVRRLVKQAIFLLESPQNNDETFLRHIEQSYVSSLYWVLNHFNWYEMKEIV